MQIVNFVDVNIIFSKDLLQFLTDIFEKFKIRKLKFSCYTDNPIEPKYEKMIKKFGGRVVGIQKKNDKLTDGDYHDLKMYELLRSDYLKKKEMSGIEFELKGVIRKRDKGTIRDFNLRSI